MKRHYYERTSNRASVGYPPVAAHDDFSLRKNLCGFGVEVSSLVWGEAERDAPSSVMLEDK
jgi:hypothetical protein